MGIVVERGRGPDHETKNDDEKKCSRKKNNRMFLAGGSGRAFLDMEWTPPAETSRKKPINNTIYPNMLLFLVPNQGPLRILPVRDSLRMLRR